MHRPARLLTFLAVLGSVLGLAACGASNKNSAGGFTGEKKTIAQVVERLQSEGRKRNASAICTNLLAPALVQKIAATSKRTCASVLKDALNDADSFELQVKKV